MTKRIAFAESAVAVLGKAGVIRHGVLQPQSAEPPVRQVELHLFAQAPLGANTEAVSNDQHPDHQFRINRGPTGVAIERSEMAAQLAQIKESINPAQQMIGRNVSIEIE